MAANEQKKVKVVVTKDSGLFWLPGKPPKGETIEVDADLADRLIAAKHAVAAK